MPWQQQGKAAPYALVVRAAASDVKAAMARPVSDAASFAKVLADAARAAGLMGLAVAALLTPAQAIVVVAPGSLSPTAAPWPRAKLSSSSEPREESAWPLSSSARPWAHA